jgi:DNA-binding response OmpR family regulator
MADRINLRILVVDDDSSILEFIETELSYFGIQVEKADNGFMGWRKTETFRPHVVLMDVFMPRLDGYGAVKKIREMPAIAKTPVIMLTGMKTSKDEVKKAIAAGANGYLVKPIDLSVLYRKIFQLVDVEPPQELRERFLEEKPGGGC